MKILILGGDGMLGHQLLLSLQKNFDVGVTLRQSKSAYKHCPLFTSKNSNFNIDVRNDNDLAQVIENVRPHVLINAIGLVKQRPITNDVLPNLEINAVLPHRLANLCKQFDARFIHISTDCVFSGNKGNYSEHDISDATDVYGRTKFLGEVNEPHCLTLRTSFIGLELSRKTSLLEWFLAQKGSIKGFCRAIYSGLTTLEMADVLEFILNKHIALTGTWHVASEPISKFDLLIRLKNLLQREDIEIIPDNEFVCDRSMQGSAFEKATNYQIPNWDSMLKKLVNQIHQRAVKKTESACSV